MPSYLRLSRILYRSMNKKTLKSKYFQWMCSLVCDKKHRDNYQSLLSFLFDTEFIYAIGLDGNRAADGVDLRYLFSKIRGYSDHVAALYLDDEPCSMLEMMIALANRCEVQIMDNPEIGDRTGIWFWEMIESLGLHPYTDDNFDESEVSKIVKRFIHRKYSANGKGGLFTIHDSRQDMRSIEIWYQMMQYLNEEAE